MTASDMTSPGSPHSATQITGHEAERSNGSAAQRSAMKHWGLVKKSLALADSVRMADLA